MPDSPPIANQRRLKRYVKYQQMITERHLIPFFRRHDVPLDGPILDIGCATGGCAIAIASALGVPVTGFDILPQRIETAREANQKAGTNVTFDVVNVLEDPLPEGKWTLALLRDVVEHLPDLNTALTRIRPVLREDGLLYVTFPPWKGPFAGHQHNARGFGKFMPYAHVFFPGLFLKLLHRWEARSLLHRWGGGDWLEDERQIFKNRLTREKFERAVKDTGWSIAHRNTYLIRPALMRSGLPKTSNSFVGLIPILGEMLTTGVEYLLKVDS